tara:strand:- start:7278 stop:7808 length:531 start_codon:yes stop_codon:yes gene_type:complete
LSKGGGGTNVTILGFAIFALTVIVDLTVAVVVDTVTFIFLRTKFACTGLVPLAVGTDLLSFTTGCDLAGLVWATIARFGFAICTTTAFVCETITIVVFVVAFFFVCGFDLTRTLTPFAILACLCSGFTGTYTFCTVCACVAGAFISVLTLWGRADVGVLDGPTIFGRRFDTFSVCT